jgi:Protein of unknown function (DUF4019)
MPDPNVFRPICLRPKGDPQYTSFMKTFLLNFAAMIALWVVGSAFGASSYSVITPDCQAVATATKWLSVVDAGNYAEAFAKFPARIRLGGDAVGKYWVGYLRAKRAPLGRALSRKLVKAWFSKTLPGSPDGYYEFFHYNTSFERKTQAAESVTLTKESGQWQVSGYRFR